MELAIIYARSSNGVIGMDGGIPWSIPEDMAHFKRLTAGCTVIMGRKTWESLPERSRPLPGRRNIVLSHRLDFEAPGAEVAHSLGEALCMAALKDKGTVWVMGGTRLYTRVMPHADRIEVTEVHKEFEGDTFAPDIDPGLWWMESRNSSVTPGGLCYSFVSYVRRDGT